MGVVQGLIASLKTSSSGYDSDAQAFFTATGITDGTQKSAVNQLVLDYKSYSIWTKCIAIYPLVGGSAALHKWNLKDPRDLDAAFRIVWGGTVTHNSNGITGDGSTGYGDTKIISSSHLTANSVHLSYYSRTTSSAFASDIGVNDGTAYLNISIYDTSYSSNLNDEISHSSVVDNGGGYFLANRSGNNATQGYKNGSSIVTDTNDILARPTTYSIYILGENNAGTLAIPSSRNIALVSIGASLNSTEVANKYTADQAFQTTLGRNL